MPVTKDMPTKVEEKEETLSDAVVEKSSKPKKSAYRLTSGIISVEKANGERRIVMPGDKILLTDDEAAKLAKQITPFVAEAEAE